MVRVRGRRRVLLARRRGRMLLAGVVRRVGRWMASVVEVDGTRSGMVRRKSTCCC